MCMTFATSGECRYGKKCLFAHGTNDLRRPAPLLVQNDGVSTVTARPVMPPLPPGPPPKSTPPIQIWPPLPPGPPPPPVLPLPTGGTSDWSSLIKTIDELHEILEQDGHNKRDDMPYVTFECVVCLSGLSTHCFMPCKHLCVCKDCAVEFSGKECYICREGATLVHCGDLW